MSQASIIKHTKSNRFLLLKTLFAVLFLAGILNASSNLTATTTFIMLDSVLAIYLASLFSGRLKYMFLIHPAFLLFSSYGFEIPFSEIGVGFTYQNTYIMLIDPSSGGVGEGAGEFIGDKDTVLGFGRVYFGIIPILWLPAILYDQPPDIVHYYSMGFFNMLYVALAVFVSKFYNILRDKNLLIIALFATVSPTFFVINTTLHRYGLLVFGLLLFLVSYIGLFKEKKSFLARVGLILVLSLSILCIGFSKPQIIYVICLFIGIDLLSSNKIPVMSQIYRMIDKRLFLILLVPLGLQLLSMIMLPQEHISEAMNRGGQLTSFANIPIIGLLIRVVYAMLSPFPWIGFSQSILYGYNTGFILVHIISAVMATWMIMSLVMRTGTIFKADAEDRTIVLLGACIIFSLMFSSIGFHVYLAPALPFLAIIFLRKRYRVSLFYPVSFCLIMEVSVQSARIFL